MNPELRPSAATMALWRAQGWWTDETLPERLAATAAALGGTRLLAAVGDEGPLTTLGAFHASAAQIAAGLAATGVKPGDVVAVQAPNRIETWIAYSAILLAGATVLPIVPIYGAAELRFILADAGAGTILTPLRWRSVDYVERVARASTSIRHLLMNLRPGETSSDWSRLAGHPAISQAPAPATAPDDVAAIVYTSGTTGAPKGVQHSHRSLLAELRVARRADHGDRTRRVLGVWPPGHVAGLLAYLRYVAEGLDTVLMEAWDPAAAARLIAREQVTGTSGTPFHLMALLDLADAGAADLSSLAEYSAGGTMIPPALMERCEALGLATFRSYGLSEHPTVSCGAAGDPAPVRIATDGWVSPGTEVRIVDDYGRDQPSGATGEIWCRGPEMFVGYRDPAHDIVAVAPGGWLKTGDVGVLTADGLLTITDRKKDLVIRGGENIASREVEDHLMRHPDIVEAAVVGVPDSRLGERVGAFLIPREGAVPTVEELQGFFARLGIARQKTPEHVWLRGTLPRNAAGKIVKTLLREEARRLAIWDATRE